MEYENGWFCHCGANFQFIQCIRCVFLTELMTLVATPPVCCEVNPERASAVVMNVMPHVIAV